LAKSATIRLINKTVRVKISLIISRFRVHENERDSYLNQDSLNVLSLEMKRRLSSHHVICYIPEFRFLLLEGLQEW
jgi:hypothetical protein